MPIILQLPLTKPVHHFARVVNFMNGKAAALAGYDKSYIRVSLNLSCRFLFATLIIL